MTESHAKNIDHCTFGIKIFSEGIDCPKTFYRGAIQNAIATKTLIPNDTKYNTNFRNLDRV